MPNRTSVLSILLLFFSYISFAQQTDNSQTGGAKILSSADMMDTAKGSILTIKQCIEYALHNQPALKQSYIDEQIARTNNAIGLSAWLPQVTGSAYYQHYFELPVAFTSASAAPIVSGVYNVSTPAIAATQTIFSTDVLLAARASKLNTLHAKQNIDYTKIEVVSNVSKAFYNLLNSLEQTVVLKEDTARLNKNLSDAYHRYESGISDKVDYKQATISLNNSVAQLVAAYEAVHANYALLEQQMGLPSDKKFTVNFDTTQMMQDIYYDTTAVLEYEKRIEYKLLLTQRMIQRETTLYYQLGFIPTFSAYYDYNQIYESNSNSDLYSHAYPTSYFGIQLSVPLFTGFRRLENIHKSKLQEQRVDLDEANLKLEIYSEYMQALSSYKSNFFNLKAMKENVAMAQEVYNIVNLQYREGIKQYLDVIVAESDLQASEINYLNALFRLLSSKIDLEKAMGDISPEI